MTSRSCKQRGVLSASRCGIYYHPQYGKLMLLTLDHKEIVKDFQSSFSFCRLYLFIYIHTYTHTYVYLCKYICVYVCIHIYIYMYICIYTYVCVCVCVCVFVCVCVCVHLPSDGLSCVAAVAAVEKVGVGGAFVTFFLTIGCNLL